MKMLKILILSASILVLGGCGSDERREEILLQLDLGQVISVKEKQSATITPTIVGESDSLAFSWQQLSGPQLQFANTSVRNVEFTAPELDSDSTAVVGLTVTSSKGFTVTDTLEITIKANMVPLINASPMSFSEKSVVYVDYEASDADGTIEDVQWVQTYGPSVAILSRSPDRVELDIPAVVEQTQFGFVITATDNDGDQASIEQHFTIDPILESYSTNGILSGQEMAGAEIIATIGGAVYRTNADSQGIFSITVTLDDDTTNDIMIFKAISVEKPGLDMWTIIPSLRQYDIELPIKITPFTTGFNAMVTRENGQLVPRSIEELSRAESQVLAADAVLASILVSAYAQTENLGLPLGYNSIFNTLVNNVSMAEFKLSVEGISTDLLTQIENELIANTTLAFPIEKPDLNAGWRLLIPQSNGTYSTAYYDFGSSNLISSDSYYSYQSDWTMLAGTVQTQVKTDLIPHMLMSVDNTDLKLTAAEIAKLHSHNIESVEVKFNQIGEQFTMLTNSMSTNLIMRRTYKNISILPIDLPTEELRFETVQNEKYEYVLKKELYSQTINLEASVVQGKWSMPVYQANNHIDQSKFIEQRLQFDADLSGRVIATGEPFTWQVAVDAKGQEVLLISYFSGQTQALRFLSSEANEYEVDTFVYDSNGTWKAASRAVISRIFW